MVPEPGKPQTNYKLKYIFSEECKGAVTALTCSSTIIENENNKK